MPDKPAIEEVGVPGFFKRMWVQPNADDLTIIANMIDQGQVKVRLDRVYTLAQASDALARSEAQLAVGKIVIELI